MSKNKEQLPVIIKDTSRLQNPELWQVTGINSGRYKGQRYTWMSPNHKGDKKFGWIKSNPKRED